MRAETEWAGIPGFPDYVVSNYGEVVNARLNHILRPTLTSYGHLKVTLRRDGEHHDRLVHRLVAECFISGFEEDIRIKHKDGDKTNNFVYNLRFRSERRMGQLISGEDHIQYRRVRIVETGAIFRTVEDCARHVGGDISTIYRVIKGERVSHKGYTYEFVES